MSSTHQLRAVQKIPADISTCWKFFSDPANLPRITPSFLHLSTTSPVDGQPMYAGQTFTYRVRPLFGIGINWLTEITHVEHEKMFVDQQRKGPYALWHHEHHFKAIEGGTEMTDLVKYRLPFAPAGDVVHGWLVKPRLKQIFEFRFEEVNKLLGAWKGGAVHLQFD